MAQRFPDDYQGILAGAPAIHFEKLGLGQTWPQVPMLMENEGVSISQIKLDLAIGAGGGGRAKGEGWLGQAPGGQAQEGSGCTKLISIGSIYKFSGTRSSSEIVVRTGSTGSSRSISATGNTSCSIRIQS